MRRLAGRKYLILAIALAAFAIGLVAALWHEREQEAVIHAQFRGDYWVVAQTELEFIRFAHALAQYGMGDAEVAADDLRLRFEIL